MSYFQITINSTVNTAKLESILSQLATTEQIMRETSDEVVSTIKNNIQLKGVVDTGALLDSIENEIHGDYAIIHDGVTYGFFNEFGTYKMAARPFFVPGVESWANLIGGSLRRIFI